MRSSPRSTAPTKAIPVMADRRPAGGRLVSLAEGDLVYIYNEGDRTEELFNEREDPRELTNLASKSAMLPNLEQFRRRLANLKAP